MKDLEIVVFSKDRACQLDALLRSLAEFVDHPHHVHVLYTSSRPEHDRAYACLRSLHRQVHWIREGPSFRDSLLELLATLRMRGLDYLMFLVDDMLFTRAFTAGALLASLDDEDVLAISLRLGENITYCYTRDCATTPPDFSEGHRWAWRGASPGYWNYPMSVDGHIYRLSDFDALDQLPFSSPNSLEARLDGQAFDRPDLVCEAAPTVVNLPLNIVQHVFANRHGGGSSLDLDRGFLAGFRLDYRPFIGQTWTACHVELDVRLELDSRPREPPPVPPGLAAEASGGYGPVSSRAAPPPAAGSESGDPGSGDPEPSDPEPSDPEPSDPEGFRPLRRRLEAEEDGEELRVVSGDAEHVLNPTARALWELCDGHRTVEQIIDHLAGDFAGDRAHIAGDVEASLHVLLQNDLLEEGSSPQSPSRRLDLRRIPCFVIHSKHSTERRDFMEAQLRELGIQATFVYGVTSRPQFLGVALAHVRVLRLEEARTPFLVLEDDCEFTSAFRPVVRIPEHADALYLGVSSFGLKKPGEFSWGRPGTVRAMRYDADHLRVFNMLARHAVVYLSERYRRRVIENSIDALTNADHPYPGDIGCALLHASHLVLTPNEPMCHQSRRFTYNHASTWRPLEVDSK